MIARLLRGLASTLVFHRLPRWAGLLAMSIFFAWAWIDPYRFGPRAPYDAAGILVFEFLFLHSTPLSWAERGGRLLALVYVPVAALVAYLQATPTLLVVFLWHVATMVAGDWEGRADERARLWYFAGVGVFLVAGLGAVLTPFELGWNESLPRELGWSGGPTLRMNITPAWGTYYFAGRLVLELLRERWGPEAASSA